MVDVKNGSLSIPNVGCFCVIDVLLNTLLLVDPKSSKIGDACGTWPTNALENGGNVQLLAGCGSPTEMFCVEMNNFLAAFVFIALDGALKMDVILALDVTEILVR